MKKLLALLLVCILFCACTPEPIDLTNEFSQKIENLTGTPSEKFNLAQMAFSAELLKQNFEGKNTLVSPLSVKLALAMVLNGAEGDTKKQMEALSGLSVDELNEEIYKYVSSLKSNEKSKLHIANSIWIKDDKDFSVNDSFLQTNADYYNTGVFKEPLDSTTIKKINNWVDENTDGMIDKIVDSLAPETVACLINALAFDAEWSSPYLNRQVRDGSFTSLSGNEQTVEMMHSTEYTYLEDANATGFIKNYKSAQYAFVALLPKNDITEYISSLNGESIKSLLESTSNEAVICQTPKFSYDYSVTLNASLKSMGMTDAFDLDTADFSKMTDLPIYIDRVLHKTHITVDEKGTKAGAATAVMMNAGSAMMEKPKEVILDRPFVYMIIDTENNLPIFIGALTDVK